MPRPDQAPPVEFKAQEGTQAQLPRGEATELNAGLAAVPEQEEIEAAPTELAEEADFEPLYEPETEDDEFIFGPTTRPDEEQWVGAEPRRGLSPEVKRRLPALEAAASAPNASPQLKRLVALLMAEED